MQKVRIIALSEARYRVVSALHKMGAIDLRKSDLPISDDTPPENYTQISEMLIKVQGALDIIGKKELKAGKLVTEKEIAARFKELEPRMQKVYELRDQLQAIAEDGKALSNAEMIAKSFGGLKVDLGNLNSNVLSFIAVLVGDKQLAKFSEHHKRSGRNSEIMINRVGKNSSLIFAAYRKGDEQMEESLKGLGEELDLHAKYLTSTPQSILKSIAQKRAENATNAAKAKADLEKMGQSNHSAFAVLKESLAIELARAEVSSTFKRTEKTFAMEGWVPKKRLGELKSLIHRTTENRFVLEEMKTDELAPTLVNRPGFLKPFDYLMEFFSMPRSDEIDPTWIFIISFPIFYGLMVSDVGYGIASFILSQIIIMKTDPEGLMCNTAKVWRLSAIPAIIVGVITDQYFGFGLNHFFLPGYQSVSWLGDITTIIVLTIVFGLIQVTLGFIFGFINEWHHGHKKLAISKITSIIGLLAGTVAVAGIFFHALGTGISLDAAALAIGGIIATGALSGTEAAEITNLITHPLSYARLMGFGLGSIIIAMLIDQAFTPHLGSGVGGILLFIVFGIIFVLLHVMNMILSIFEGIVQAARLNFVEFFSKFYKGGGVKYRPFSYKRVYTEE
jgi:V/A-type H+-transporting ATPase subunit I